MSHRPQFHARMPVEKLFLYLALLALGLALLYYLHQRKALTGELLAGVMTSFIIISAVELIPELAGRILDRSTVGKFRQFFGEAAFKEDVRLVFPFRTLAAGVKQNPFITHCRPIGTATARPEGVNGWLAFQDVRGAVYVTNTIAEMTDRKVIALHDKDVEGDQRNFCIISFGLGFTGFTYQAAGYFDPPLFRVTLDTTREPPHYETDGFAIEDPQPDLPATGDIGIVVRIVPPHDHTHPHRVWFVCAGRTAAGTAAAGYFLANSWDQMHELYAKHGKALNKDSVLVVVQHTGPHKGSDQPGYIYDETAAFARRDGAPIIRWARAMGIRDDG